MPPSVSVIMPLYNAEPFLGAAIESCVAQTMQNWELIMVDDASTDDTLTVARRATNDSRIRLLANSTNCGPGPSRNLGLEEARGAWITVLDADDLYHPERLACLLKIAESSGPRFVYLDELRRFSTTLEVSTAASIAHQQNAGDAFEISLVEWFRTPLSALRGQLPADLAIPAFSGVRGLQRQRFELVGELA